MATYDEPQLSKRLYLMPGTALGGEQVYITALCCAVNADLQKAWSEYLEETRQHQQVALGLRERALLAQTKDYRNWKLPGRVAEKATAAACAKEECRNGDRRHSR